MTLNSVNGCEKVRNDVNGKGSIEIEKAPKDEVFNIDIRNKPYPAQLTKKSFVTGGHK